MGEKHAGALSTRELAEWQELAESDWRKAGVAEPDILLSRRNGMDARDIASLRQYSAANQLLIIMRCPKVTALTVDFQSRGESYPHFYPAKLGL